MSYDGLHNDGVPDRQLNALIYSLPFYGHIRIDISVVTTFMAPCPISLVVIAVAWLTWDVLIVGRGLLLFPSSMWRSNLGIGGEEGGCLAAGFVREVRAFRETVHFICNPNFV